MTSSKEYVAAHMIHTAAFHAYTEVAEKFSAGEVSYEDFGAAAKIKKAADAAFDIAFDAEANRPEEVAEEIDDGQTELEI